MKRVYRRAIFDDSLSMRIYDLSLRPLNEREVYYNQLVNQFVETNFYPEDFGKQVVNSLISGLQLAIMLPVFTDITEDDGEWEDEYGVRYSADRKKLIRGKWTLKEYDIRVGTIAVCDEAFAAYNFKFIPNRTTPHIEDTCMYHFYGKPDLGGKYNMGNTKNYYYTRIQHILIPDTVLFLGEKAFDKCIYLTKIVMPNSIVSIGNGCFMDCKSLTNITIPNSVTSIGERAFEGCKSLTNITIPNSVTSIGKRVFAACNSLTDIIVPNSIVSIEEGGFAYCTSLTNITISDSVTDIGKQAFWNCRSLTNITIPDSVTSIGNEAFSGCI